MSPTRKLKLAAPTFREQLARRAQEVGLDTEHLDRALILGQIAALLSEDPELKGKIAHKGAAMLHLVNKSRRFSRDLDSGDIRGQRVDQRTVRRALSTAKAKKVVVGVDQLTQGGSDSLTLFLDCRRLHGGAAMKIQFSINWSEPFTLPPVMESYALPDGTPVKVPVMDPRERAAEKLRAFLDRGEAPDAYDVWWYATTVFPGDEVLKLSKLVKLKLAKSNLASDLDLHAHFKEMERSAREQWAKGTGLIIAAQDKPSWTAVSKAGELQARGAESSAMKKNRLRGGLERNGRTIITGEISALISLITFIVAGTPLAVIVGLTGIILTAIVGIVVTERENRARERERREQEAHIAPVRASALKQVSSAAFELVRYAMPYRDVAGAQPRQARISIVDLARGVTPEAGWAVTEVDRLWDELRARARAFAADSGPAVAELDLQQRRHVHAINELLSQALDDMSAVAYGATTMFNGRQVGQDGFGDLVLKKLRPSLRTRT